MSMQAWWPRLAKEARDWLVANNGDALPPWVTDEIRRAGGDVGGETHLSDAQVDWIEAVANGETPEPVAD